MKLFKKTGKPKKTVPETYRIAWWPYQEKLIVEGFVLEIVESELNLLNNRSLVSYTIKGTIKFEGTTRFYVKKIHVSEQFNTDTAQNCDRIIELTPVVAVKKGKNRNEAVEKFELTNQYSITSGYWGINRIKFVCGNKAQTVELNQHK